MNGDFKYMPALRFRWLTPLYDWLIRWLLPETLFKRALLDQARLQTGEKVLDAGCGTATLTIMAARDCPGCQLTGVDADPAILQIASRKVRQAQLQNITLLHYTSHQLPFPDGHFDKIMCSLLFCNLLPEEKKAVLTALCRVLKPVGELHIADWGKPASFWVRPGFWLLQAMGGFRTTGDLARGQLPDYLKEAGFSAINTDKYFNTWFGTLYLYRSRKQN